MNEQNTNLTEVKENPNLAVKQTAMDLILTRALENDVDMDRLERLISLREKEINRQLYKSFVSDLSDMQSKYKEITAKSTHAYTLSKYATLDCYIESIKEALKEHHFALFSCIKNQTHAQVTIEMTLVHPSGNKISTEGTFPLDGKGNKTDIQSIGSTITYARRYLLGMLLNVASKEDDTDGNKTKLSGPASPQQMADIKRLVQKTNANETKMLASVNVNSISEMTFEQAQTVLNNLYKKQNRQASEAKQRLGA
ncbi:ERF family protein [Bartonella harrusi]|uniref:ERF family protein n=1 Tax=Bartonella harrusi TaxID=2961895 RepID=A0ABY5EVA5_9HYPH|nr:ERF family protein [Bartonella harrusi]UTO29227.1 ERF family protein [Bartonella harrusi]